MLVEVRCGGGGETVGKAEKYVPPVSSGEGPL